MVTAMHETVPRHVALRKSALLDHLSEAILAVSRKGDIFPVNNAGLKLLALTGRSVKKLKEILFSELSLPRVLEAGDATEIRLRKLNIADHTYLIDSFFDGADLVLLLSDITDVKKMAEDLSQQFTHLLRFKMSMQCITDGIVITEDEIDSLRRFKDDVKEVAQGYECGIGLDKFSDIKEGDIFEAFIMEEYRD